MWAKKKSKAPDAGPSARSPSGCRLLCALLGKLALAALLVYGALHVFVRTDFFRRRVEAELSRRTGMEMRAGRIRATESLNLRIRDVIGVSGDAGVEARIVRIRWRLFRPRGAPMLESVRVDGLALTFAPDADGVVQPAFLGRAAQRVLKSAGATLPAAARAAEQIDAGRTAGAGSGAAAAWIGGPVEIRWASARWQDAAGNVEASVSGMALTWAALAVPGGGRIAHVDCRAAQVDVAGGPRIAGLHVELIDAGDRQFLVALDATDWGAARKPRPVEAEFREMLDAMD